MSLDLETFLRRALKSGRKIDLAQLQLLNLGEVRDAAGDNWPKLRARIFETSQALIDKRLSREDALVRCEEGFLSIFADPEIDVSEKVAEIQAALAEFFLGRPELARLVVTASVQRIEAGALTQVVAASAAASPPTNASDPVPATRPAAPAENKPADPHGFRPQFRPVWDALYKRIYANICTAKAHVGGRLLDARTAAQRGMIEASELEIDLFEARTAASAVRALVKAKRDCRFIIRADAATLRPGEGLTGFEEAVSRIPPDERERILVRVDHLAQTPDADLDAVNRLGLQVIDVLEFGAPIEGERATDGDIAMTDAPPLADTETEGLRDRDQKALARQVGELRDLGADLWVDDLRDLKALKEAMDGKVRLLSGVNILPGSVKPTPLRDLSFVDLCRPRKAA